MRTKDKILYIVLTIVAIVVFVDIANKQDKVYITPQTTSYIDDTTISPTMSRVDTIIAMTDAFIRQESNGNDSAVSPCGKYVGCLQMGKIMVDEANRLSDTNYSYEDRYSRKKSIEMFIIVMNHHNKNYDIDKAISVWNPRCPDTYRNNVTRYYYECLNQLSL